MTFSLHFSKWREIAESAWVFLIGRGSTLFTIIQFNPSLSPEDLSSSYFFSFFFRLTLIEWRDKILRSSVVFIKNYQRKSLRKTSRDFFFLLRKTNSSFDRTSGTSDFKNLESNHWIWFFKPFRTVISLIIKRAF